MTPLLQAENLSKHFGPNHALDSVDFELRSGEIHALLGENGAGKSTLMNVLSGLLRPSSGRLILDGKPVTFATPADAARAGIGMVHQHFLLVPSFTVAENLALAAPKSVSRAEEVAARLGWTIPLRARVADLPVGTQQRVEILKALLADARILLFDEPTAVLAPPEIFELFVVLRALRAEGRSLVFVSHKLGEVMRLCDRVTVLRRGKQVGTVNIEETNAGDLARRMVGEDGPPAPKLGGVRGKLVFSSPPNLGAGGPILTVQNLATKPAKDAVALQNVTFTLAAGEILGVAGVDGNGQTELAETLTGLRNWTGGAVTLGSENVKKLTPSELAKRDIALVPPDRHREGLALTLSVAENLTLEAANRKDFRRGPFLNRKKLRRFAEETAREFDVRADNLNVPASSLSGGNQQKIVLARALWRRPKLLVAVSPTRGLDVAATAYVHQKLRERARDGGAILLISTELDEVLALSDRVAVLYEGRIVGIVASNTPRETIGLLMGGKAVA